MVLVTLIQGAYGDVQITASGGGNGESGSVSMNFDTLKTTSVRSQIAINGATITPSTVIAGPVPKFEQTHAVKDKSGKSASVYVKVVNAPLGLDYRSEVLPREGNLRTIEDWISAEQWLTVTKADSIKCTATASYGTLSADVGIEEVKGRSSGDYVTLTEYDGRAYASATQVEASQTATAGSGNSIKIYGHAKDPSGSYSIDTPITSVSGLTANFQGLDALSSAGTTTQVTQKEHVMGKFSSKAIAGKNSKTRTSNYGTEYDLNMQAIKGSLPTGILGYYVNPSMATASLGVIQGAVNAAQSGDTINAAAGTYIENVQVDKSLTVNGAGAGNTIVDGNLAGSVFTIGMNNPNVDVALAGMTFRGGSGTIGDPSGNNYVVGGGILNRGKTTITDSIVSGNSANLGGGVANSGALTVTGSTISGNRAGMGGGGIANIGGYFSGSTFIPATLIVQGASTISGNSATGANGGIGGGILNDGKATITASTISENSALSSDTLYGEGGGIYNGGYYSGNTFIPAIMTIQGASDISKNNADFGGGIRNTGTLTVEKSTISSNSASMRGGGIANGGEAYSSTLTVTDSTISGNSASTGGGGIANFGTLTVTGSTISGNSAGTVDNLQSGGGIGNGMGGEATIKNCEIFGNKATWDGGGLHNWASTMTVSDSNIYENTADENGGGVYNGAFKSEGLSSTMTLTSCKITKNNAENLGGGVANFDGGLATTTGCTIEANKAIKGGGLANWEGGKFAIDRSTFSGNSANSGGGIYNDGTVNMYGGSIISWNSATYGGGIWNSRTATVTGSTISGNSAFDGGGIHNWQGTATVTGSIISGNSAEHVGGGIFNSGTATVTDSTISENSAKLDGGGIHNWQGTATVSGSIISRNSAENVGGGIFNSETATVTDSTISENSANSGGGIFNSGTLNQVRGSITGNTAGGGGGIFNFITGIVNLNEGSITGNTADVGGGIFNAGTLNQDEGSIIFGNSPNDIYP